MKKIFLKLTESKSRYWMFESAQTKNFLLSNLVFFLEVWGDRNPDYIYTSKGMNWEWLSLDKTEDGKQVYLSDKWEIKKQAEKESLSLKEEKAFEEAYDDYVEKRRDDVPELYMTIENYVEIVQKWQDIVLKRKPQYIIVSQGDTGYVDLVGKDELSEQDLADMRIEHEKYLKYKVAYDKYVKSRPDLVDELWHGPESSEYEADWQKYLDEPLD